MKVCIFGIKDIGMAKPNLDIEIKIEGFDEIELLIQNVLKAKEAYFKALKELENHKIIFSIGNDAFILDKKPVVNDK